MKLTCLQKLVWLIHPSHPISRHFDKQLDKTAKSDLHKLGLWAVVSERRSWSQKSDIPDP